MESLNKFIGEFSPAIRFEDRDKEFLVALCYELQANWLAEQKAGMSLSCEYEQQAAENAALKEQVAHIQAIISEEAKDSGNVILELTTLQSKSAALVDALENLMDMMEPPPDKSCSCFISPPCNDCVEYSGIREAIEIATAALAAFKGEK